MTLRQDAAEQEPAFNPSALDRSDTGCKLVGTTSNPTMYASEWLARLVFGFRIEGGVELREAARLASRFTAAVAT
jgi:hypothetical protein